MTQYVPNRLSEDFGVLRSPTFNVKYLIYLRYIYHVEEGVQSKVNKDKEKKKKGQSLQATSVGHKERVNEVE